VARSAAHVSVARAAGKGVTVSVDAIARGIELGGLGTIGAVRTESTSTATGRDGRARSQFRRTICDVRVGAVVVSGCTGDEAQQASLVKQINDTLGGRGEVRLRVPDTRLAAGSAHGYLTALQRDRAERFEDDTITRDHSLAVPALEVILFQGDGGTWGAGRQVLQLAGAQASASYGIACTYGIAVDGTCAGPGEPTVDGLDASGGPNGSGAAELGASGAGPGDAGLAVPGMAPTAHGERRSALARLLANVPRALAQGLHLLFNHPRELGLLLAVWALLYAPCYLGERRRNVRNLRARRAAGGVA
jgi:hypothetical protein